MWSFSSWPNSHSENTATSTSGDSSYSDQFIRGYSVSRNRLRSDRTELSRSTASRRAVLPLSFFPTRQVRSPTVNHSESSTDL